MPLILSTPKRHSDDLEFFQILQQIRFNQITEETWEKLKEKLSSSANSKSSLETTHIMGYRHMVDMINETIINYLPIDESDQPFISIAEDRLNKKLWDTKKCNKHFRKYTNFPEMIHIQKGVRVMFLNNTLYENGIYNGSIGIIMKVHNEQSIDETTAEETLTRRRDPQAKWLLEREGLWWRRRQLLCAWAIGQNCANEFYPV